MSYIITPSSSGWGNWQDHLARAKLHIRGKEQQSLFEEVMQKNAYQGDLNEVCFDLMNPCYSDCPAEYFYRAFYEEYETLHPLIVLAACAAWEGQIPAENFNVASPHLLADEKGKDFILLLQHRGEGGNILSLIPTDMWVQRPGYFVGISSSSYQYKRYDYAHNSKRISL